MISPKEPWHKFTSPDEKLSYLRAVGLIPKTKGLRPIYYSGAYTSTMTTCDVVGYIDDGFLVISFDGELHSIHKDYLLEMQSLTVPSEYKINYIKNPQASPLSFVVFDFETTDRNSKVAEVIEIGAVKYINGTQKETFQSFVQPEGQISLFAQDVNSITDDMVAGQDPIGSVLPKFLNFVGDLPLVAYNGATFDFKVLERICCDLKIPVQNDGYDAMQIAKKKLSCPTGYSLGALCEYYNLGVVGHRALGDALVTADIWKLCFSSDFPEESVSVSTHGSANSASAEWPETIALYKCFLRAIEATNQNYDLKAILTEHRIQKDSETEALSILGNTVFIIKGTRTKNVYFTKVYRNILASVGAPISSLSNGAIKITPQALMSLLDNTELAGQCYEACLLSSDPFGCCSAYTECSDAKHCIRTDPMFYGRCQYRKNLMQGRIFYGENALGVETADDRPSVDISGLLEETLPV